MSDETRQPDPNEPRDDNENNESNNGSQTHDDMRRRHPLGDQDESRDQAEQPETVQGEASTGRASDEQASASGKGQGMASNPLVGSVVGVTPRYTWSEVWTAAITKPRAETYAELLDDPAAQPIRAYIWVFLSALVTTFVTLNAFVNDPALQEALNESELGAEVGGTLFLSLLCATPIAAVFTLFVFIVFAGAIQFTAQQLMADKFKTGPHQLASLLYVMGAITAPINVLSLITVFLPLGLVSLGLFAYQVYLYVLAVQAVYRVEMQPAATAVLIPGAVLVVLQFVFLGSVL